MEFCQLGDLATFVKKRDKLASHPVTAEMIRNYPNPPGAGFNEVIVRHFSKQLSSALEFLRSKNLVHRDLKPQNLLLNPPLSWISKERPENRPFEVSKDSSIPLAGLLSLPCLKIADFGFARHLPTTTLAETLCGSPLYMAPEILRYERYDAKADLWSVGTVLYELMVGKPPFRAANHVDLLRKIEKTNDKIKFPDEVVISDDMQIVIRALLKKFPTDRMSWEGFFQSAINTREIPGLVEADKPRAPAPSPIDTPQIPIVTWQSEDVPLGVERVMRVEPQEPQIESRNRPPTPRSQTGTPANLSTLARRTSNSLPKRPVLMSHDTAPAMVARGQIRDRLVAESPPDKPRLGEPSSPRVSTPRETVDRERERLLQRANQDRTAREARERAAQDVAFERDYVMVEKRAVEVNAFADELAASPQIHGAPRTSSALHPAAVIRRATTQGVLPSATRTLSASPKMQVTGIPETIHERKRSWDAKYTPKISATSAIAAALNTVNFRLGGGPLFPSLGKGPSPPQGFGIYSTFPSAQAGQLLLPESERPLAMDEDQKVLVSIEERATRSDVVYGFAEVKYKQLVPIAPSNDNVLGLRKAGQTDNAGGETVQDDDDLTIEAVVEISEEALVLYVKTLAILQNTFNLAARWWNQKHRGEIVGEMSTSPRANDIYKPINSSVDIRINNVVQWARNRFNECLEKSEYVSRRLSDAQRKLPLHHPGHPSNHPEPEGGSDTMSSSGIHLSSGVTAEKLMYDRALDMNKSAAVNELMNEDLPGCEVSYLTAIRLLEAVLEKDEEQLPRHSGARRERVQADKEESNGIEGIEEGDRKSVLNGKSSTSLRPRRE